MLMAPGVPVPARIPVKITAVEVLELVKTMLPVPDWLPIVLPAAFPTLKLPVISEIAD